MNTFLSVYIGWPHPIPFLFSLYVVTKWLPHWSILISPLSLQRSVRPCNVPIRDHIGDFILLKTLLELTVCSISNVASLLCNVLPNTVAWYQYFTCVSIMWVQRRGARSRYRIHSVQYVCSCVQSAYQGLTTDHITPLLCWSLLSNREELFKFRLCSSFVLHLSVPSMFCVVIMVLGAQFCVLKFYRFFFFYLPGVCAEVQNYRLDLDLSHFLLILAFITFSNLTWHHSVGSAVRTFLHFDNVNVIKCHFESSAYCTIVNRSNLVFSPFNIWLLQLPLDWSLLSLSVSFSQLCRHRLGLCQLSQAGLSQRRLRCRVLLPLQTGLASQPDLRFGSPTEGAIPAHPQQPLTQLHTGAGAWWVPGHRAPPLESHLIKHQAQTPQIHAHTMVQTCVQT